MSQYLEALGYYSTSSDEEYYDSEEEEEDDQPIEDEIDQPKAQVEIISQSEKKKKKSTKSKAILSQPSKKKESKQSKVLEMTEDEFNHYEQLKTGRKVTPVTVEGPRYCEQIAFKSNVFQSSKMFFEAVRPTILTLQIYKSTYLDQIRKAARSYDENPYGKSAVHFANNVTASPFLTEHICGDKINSTLRKIWGNRSGFVSCLSSDRAYLFVYGGKTENGQSCDDLIRYDVEQGRMYIFQNLHLGSISRVRNAFVTMNIPSTGIYEMISVGNDLYILGKDHSEKDLSIQIYSIRHVFDNERISIGSDYSSGYYLYRQFPRCPYQSKGLPHRVDFSVSTFKESVILFGGRIKNNVPTDEMIELKFSSTTEYSIRQIAKRTGSIWPSARYGHGSCTVFDFIYIFGGIDASGKVLNDMYRYNVSTNEWTEIICDCLLPPPLFKPVLFSLNSQSLYVFGGTFDASHNAEPSASLFRFEIEEKSWKYLEIMSEWNTVTHNPTTVRSFYVAQTKGAFQTKLYGVGVTDGLLKLNNSNDPGNPSSLCSFLRQQKDEGFLCDVVFRVKDEQTENGALSHILAHKVVIGARCSYLTQLIENSTETITTSALTGTFICEEVPIIDITNCNTVLFNTYLNFLYSGELSLDGHVIEFLEFVKAISPNDHYPIIDKICNQTERKDLSLSKQIITRMHKDLSTTINNPTFSDLVLVLDEEEDHSSQDIPQNGIFVHRLIMSRSSYFRRMLVTSGMQESREKVVHLQGHSKEIMLDVLRYLYTDHVPLTPQNCVGLMVHSMLFELIDLLGCCRRMVVSLFDNQVIWSIFEIANLYNDKTLESDCVHYMIEHYEDLKNTTGFLNLQEMLRIKIKNLVDKKK